MAIPAEALFLDFDGVICDTERAARRSWEELYAASGSQLPAEVWDRMLGNSHGAAVASADLSARRGTEVRPEELAWRLDRKRELADQEPICPGIDRLVREAAGTGRIVAVVSSSPASWVAAHLERLGLLGMVSFTVTGDEVQRHKPASDLYLIALCRAAVPPAVPLAVEDSPAGIRAARAAGIRCAAISPNARIALVSGADFVFPSADCLTLGRARTGSGPRQEGSNPGESRPDQDSGQ